MSLRFKLVLALVLLAAFSTVAIGAVTYVNTADQLRANVERSLDDAANANANVANVSDPDRDHDGRPGPPNTPHPYDLRSLDQVSMQTIASDGSVVTAPSGGELPVADVDRLVAGADQQGTQTRHDADVDGSAYRVLTVALGGGQGATMYARSLAETNRVLESIRNRTLIAVVVVIVAAALIGWFIARQVTRRLVRLTGVAEEVADTGRLDVEVPVGGSDEAGRLGTAFNEMLGALARSKDAQQRLVQDAGHELRTPLTSLRTNVSVLGRYDSLQPDDRHRLIEDLDRETHELTALVNELVDLATDRYADEPEASVALAPIVEHVADRFHRRTGRRIEVDVDATTVIGRPQALERAISNLVENAAKFTSGTFTPIEVTLRAGRLEVADRGPGIRADDLPHVFDRFYRAPDARSQPGSGLGLAIVRDVVEASGGTTFAANREGGGASVGFVLPTA